MTDSFDDDHDGEEPLLRAVESMHEQLMSSGEIKDSENRLAFDDRIREVLPVLKLLEEFKASRTESISVVGDTPRDSTNVTDNEDQGQSPPNLADVATLPSRRTLGRFEIIGQIGRGGYGIVVHARDPKLGREVAIKIPRFDAAVSADARRRFVRESMAAAGLSHPGIVTVYETGSEAGIDYLVTEFVDGDDLANRLSRGDRWTANDIARMTLRIADATAHAHAHGVLHRDIKPSNVLISGDDPESVKLSDFGLAWIEDGQEETHTGALIGTPACMSPEQAQGEKSQLGEPTDVYGIGTVLYQLLTGLPPVRGRTVVETIRMICDQEPQPPRQIDPTCPRDLQAICLKCLEKLPERRYSSANALAEDLRCFLRGDMVTARSPSAVARIIKLCRRNPLVTMVTLLITALAITGPLVALNQARLYNSAELAREQVNRTLYFSDVNLAFSDWDDANVERCGMLLKRHIPTAGQTDYRSFEWFYLWHLWSHGDQTPNIIEKEQLDSIALSPDKSIMAVGCYDGQIFLWDLAANEELLRWQAHPYRVTAVDFTSDGSKLVSANIDQEVKIWNTKTGQQLAQTPGMWALEVMAADDQIVFATNDDQLGAIRSDGRQSRSLAIGHRVRSLASHPTLPLVASAGWDGTVKIVDMAQDLVVSELAPRKVSLWSIDWSDNGNFIATGDIAGGVHIWDTQRQEWVAETSGHSNTVYAVQFSHDSRYLASGSTDSRVRIWTVPQGSLVATLQGHFGEVTSVLFGADDSVLVSAGIDGQVKRWDADRLPTNHLLEHPGPVLSIDISSDGEFIATGCDDGRVRLWNSQTGQQVDAIDAHQGRCWEVQFLRREEQLQLVTVGSDDRMCIWATNDRQLLSELPCRASPNDPLPLSVSRNQSLIAFANDDYSAAIWDLNANRIKHRFEFGTVGALAFAPDESMLAAAVGGTIRVFDCTTGDTICEFEGDRQIVYRLTFSDDKRFLAAGCYDRTIKLWSTDQFVPGDDTILPLRTMKGTSSIVDGLAFSRQEPILASGGDDRMIRLWDIDTGQQRAALKGHRSGVGDLQFSSDGRMLVSAGLDRAARIWRAPKSKDQSN